MWFATSILLSTILVTGGTELPKVTAQANDADGQCHYTLSVPASQCKDGASQQLLSRLATVEKRNELLQQELQRQQASLLEVNNKLRTEVGEQNRRITLLENALKESGIGKKQYHDCSDYRLAGWTTSGVYNVTLEHALTPINVWCDMETEKGGWTLFQKRQDGSVYFYNDWETFKKGFGDVGGEFWLGNDNLYHLTSQKKYLLRVDMWDFNDNHYWAEYDDFYVENEANMYKLHVGAYKGNAGDPGLSYVNNMPFSTRDRDNDKHSRQNVDCVDERKGAFWFNACGYVSLNGIYHKGGYVGVDSINWYQINSNRMALKKTEMKVRPMAFHRRK